MSERTTPPPEKVEGARLCVERSFDFVDQALAEGPKSGPFLFVDYGAADGSASIGLYERVARAVSERGQPLSFVLNDVETNDNATLLQNGQLATARYEAKVKVVEGSFWDPVAEPGSVSLAFSASAMHRLSTPGPVIANHIHANASLDEAVIKQYRDLALRDFRRLMAARGEELSVGGFLVAVNRARDHRDYYLGWTGKGANIYDVLQRIWQKMHREGEVSLAEYRAANVQGFYKDEDELKRVFKDASSEAYRKGLRLVDVRTETIRCPHQARFDRDGDVRAFGEGLGRTVEARARRTFERALAEREDGGKGVVDDFFRRFQEVLMSKPHRYAMDYVQSYLLVRKVG
ncbi:MAG: hypothetical protein AAGD10_15550 [Myxococcota bacterium]